MIRLAAYAFVALLLAMPGLALSGDNASKKGAGGKSVRTMSEKEQMELALSAAPSSVSNEAGVMIMGADGKLMEVRHSTNGFVCIPTVMNLPDPDPACLDAAALRWMTDLMNHEPKPTNTVPGLVYMARGGSHFEKNGRIVMQQEDGVELVKEPPHWMLMWPFDAANTKLPTIPNSSGVYIMFEGSPYAHLMVEQDPMKMK